MIYLKPDRNYWSLDIEADSLTPTQIWVVHVENIATGEKLHFREADEFRQWTKPEHIYIAHYGIWYDFPALKRLWDIDIPISRIIDTFLLSQLYSTYLMGGHSLEAWGVRVNLPKMEFTDFHLGWTPLMSEYCARDTSICARTYRALVKKFLAKGYSEQSFWIEHHFAEIIALQMRTGFKFDIARAEKLYAELREKERTLESAIRGYFKPVLKSAGVYQYRVTRQGRPYATYVKHTERYPEIRHGEDGTYEVFEYQDFNLGSPPQRLKRLTDVGFIPQKFTKKGNPSVDEESLVDFAKTSGIQEAQMLADWMVANGRANMVNTWLESVNREDECIHGNVLTAGAGSRRCTHSDPNTANIPTVEAKYGEECRSCWIARDGYVQLGVDAAGLEGRVLVHWLAVVSPDIYQAAYDYIIDTQRVFGVKDFHTLNAQSITKYVMPKERKPVKNDFYAMIYGATDKKLGLMSGGNPELGGKIRQVLASAVPGLAELMDAVDREFKQQDGFIRTLDSGFVRCPSPHAALNYKCQSAGAIIMKLAKIIFYRMVLKNKWDVLFVGDIHDEWQLNVRPHEAEAVGAAAVQAITLAGQKLKMLVPLTGEYKIGRNWAETH